MVNKITSELLGKLDTETRVRLYADRTKAIQSLLILTGAEKYNLNASKRFRQCLDEGLRVLGVCQHIDSRGLTEEDTIAFDFLASSLNFVDNRIETVEKAVS